MFVFTKRRLCGSGCICRLGTKGTYSEARDEIICGKGMVKPNEGAAAATEVDCFESLSLVTGFAAPNPMEEIDGGRRVEEGDGDKRSVWEVDRRRYQNQLRQISHHSRLSCQSLQISEHQILRKFVTNRLEKR
jgi:hypothetical protein